MDYVIMGVSGKTGAVAANALLEAGASIRVVVRDAARGEPWRARGAQVAVADANDATALAGALQGARGAYLLLPSDMRAPSHRASQQRLGAALLEAVRRSAPAHVVFLSSIAAQHVDGTGPIAGLHPIDLALRALPGTACTALRAAYFMENLAGSLGMLEQGVLPTFQPTDLAVEMVATADIGRVAARALLEGATASSVIELSASRRYSMDDAAAALSALTGRAVTAKAFPLEAMVPTLVSMGLTQDLAEQYREMTAGMISGRVAFEGGHRRMHGATELEAVLRGILRGT